MGNYISLNREIREHVIWTTEPFTRGQAWVDLIMMANYKDSFMLIKNKKILVKRGQRLTTENHLAEQWKWSRGKVRRFLDYLKNESMINTTNSTKYGTLITITNYDKWQDNKTTNDTTDSTTNDTTDSTTNGQQTVQQTVQQTDNRRYKNNKVNNNYIYNSEGGNVDNFKKNVDNFSNDEPNYLEWMKHNRPSKNESVSSHIQRWKNETGFYEEDES